MLLYRLSKCIYADDLSGAGARLYGGRWNSEGKALVYLASSRSLAVLETLVHLPPTLIPDDFCMATIEVPDHNFGAIQQQLLPQNWRDYPDQGILKQMGNFFLLENKHLLLRVPSAVVGEEFNYLLNPAHSNASKVKIKSIEPFSFDNRLIT